MFRNQRTTAIFYTTYYTTHAVQHSDNHFYSIHLKLSHLRRQCQFICRAQDQKTKSGDQSQISIVWLAKIATGRHFSQSGPVIIIFFSCSTQFDGFIFFQYQKLNILNWKHDTIYADNNCWTDSYFLFLEAVNVLYILSLSIE